MGVITLTLPSQLSNQSPGCIAGAFCSMDFIENLLEKLKEWARKVIEAVLGPEAQPEPEPIPIPVNDRRHRR